MLAKARAPVSEENLREWFRGVHSFLEENGLESVLNRPRSIFNGDETDFQLSPKIGQFLGPKTRKDINEIVSEKEKEAESLTVLCTFSAAGDALPPMIMFPYKRIPAQLTNSVPRNWPIGRSNAGWMVSDGFYEYIAHIFYPWCVKNGVRFPVIYFLNGYRSHLTLQLSDFCARRNIILCSFCPNSVHITQPCDVSIFKALKSKWKRVVQEYKKTTQQSVTKATFAPLFKNVFEQLSRSSIQNGFSQCGLYPFNESVVNYEKCIPAKREELNFTDTIEESTVNLTYNDFLSTKKFFNHFVDEEKLQEYANIRKKNEACNDPLYNLWKICTDTLEDNFVVDKFILSDNEANMEESSIEVLSSSDEQRETVGEVYEEVYERGRQYVT